MDGCHFIDGVWSEGSEPEFIAHNPATGEVIWKGKGAGKQEVDAAILSARKAFPSWSRLTFEERLPYLLTFEQKLKAGQNILAETISKATGKPLWESKNEVNSMLQKIEVSVAAFLERCPKKTFKLGNATLSVQHKPHGVAAVFGPFNFPGHLPNGHIFPALLAGNTVVFKGSELTPTVSELMISYWDHLPKGVIHLVQGGATTGHHLTVHPQIDAFFFTGSYHTGMAILDALHAHPEKIAALEMGGNNPLVVSDVGNLEAAAYLTIQSAFLTSGQRCTCARRLILPEGTECEAFLKILVQMAAQIHVGPYTIHPEPFMGPLISFASSQKVLATQALLGTQEGQCLLEMRSLKENLPFLTPGIMDVTKVTHRKDEEIFGPFLQVIRVPSFEAAIQEANATSYGLVASIFTQKKEKYQQFYQEIRAGIINWNMPTTGASGRAPFGGLGKSGNHRPSGYYAADYCAYPVASMENEEIAIPTVESMSRLLQNSE